MHFFLFYSDDIDNYFLSIQWKTRLIGVCKIAEHYLISNLNGQHFTSNETMEQKKRNALEKARIDFLAKVPGSTLEESNKLLIDDNNALICICEKSNSIYVVKTGSFCLSNFNKHLERKHSGIEIENSRSKREKALEKPIAAPNKPIAAPNKPITTLEKPKSMGTGQIARTSARIEKRRKAVDLEYNVKQEKVEIKKGRY